MKNDTQHLDFLISQYVDGTLELASRKAVEQQIATTPVARELYKDHRDVQDVLDDWGNRLPLINWDEFDQKIEARLERESVGVSTRSGWRRFARPMAIAASLLVAGSVGWMMLAHTDAVQQTNPGRPSVASVVTPQNKVRIDDGQSTPVARMNVVKFPESGATSGSSATASVTSPENVKPTTEGTALITGSSAAGGVEKAHDATPEAEIR